MKYYQNNLKDLEPYFSPDERLYRAKQLLKMLGDLKDEGYLDLCIQLEEKFSGITRLRRYLSDNHAVPFEIGKRIVDANELTYSGDRDGLRTMLKYIVKDILNRPAKDPHPSIEELITFCEWVGYEEGTAYVFFARHLISLHVLFRLRQKSHLSMADGKKNTGKVHWRKRCG